MKTVWYYDFPIGKIAIAQENGYITDVSFGYVHGFETETQQTAECARQISEYFNGKRAEFDVPMMYNASPFTKSVLECTKTIPYGETLSYGDVAKMTGNPKSARAVGQAIHRNRLLMLIPCHRIIKGDGTLGGYGGREDIKQFLLDLEKKFKKNIVIKNKI